MTKAFLLLMGFLLCSGMGSGLAVGQQPSAKAGLTAPAGKVINLDNKICPVMGVPIDANRRVTYEYEGKIYNFCCAGCVTAFKSAPQKYVAQVEAEIATKSR